MFLLREEILNEANSVLGKQNGKVIYLTKAGSHLFGLNTEKSDLDIKGLFIPSSLDICLSTPSVLNFSTNKSKNKNSSSDIDIELFSIYKFFDMLSVGDTNAYDLLFSMFSTHNKIYETNEIFIFKKFYRELLSSNSKAFLGYVVSQTKKYGVKGERFNDLKNVYLLLEEYINNNVKDISSEKIAPFIDYVVPMNLNRVNLIDRSNMSSKKRTGSKYYLEVLNKEYGDTITFEYFKTCLKKRLDSYGERSKKASEGVDFKSLSHAYRIILEFEELIDTHFIKFPLTYSKQILKVKNGDLSDFNNDYTNILSYLDMKVNEIESNKEFGLPDNINPMIFNKIKIYLLSMPF
jgi:predicted nucleotidyltransferase